MINLLNETNKPMRTALVVEDYDDTRELIRQVLERKGFRVLEAINGEEAVNTARRERPFLILMDINLPLIDGINATRRIRENEGVDGAQIVAVTAHDTPDMRRAAFDQGCNEYIAKPFELQQLEDLLEHLLPES